MADLRLSHRDYFWTLIKEVCAMQEILTKISDGIPDLFPAAIDFEVVPGIQLNEIPEWDSMSSVNFKIFLEETFGVRIPDDLLEGESTLQDVIMFIRRND